MIFITIYFSKHTMYVFLDSAVIMVFCYIAKVHWVVHLGPGNLILPW